MENVTPWIEHLNKPLVLAGFTLFVLAGLVKLFKSEKLSGKATERLMDKGMTLAFVLGFLLVVLAFASSFMQISAESQAATPQPTVKQTIKNSEGVQGQAGRDNNINVGSGTLSQQTKTPVSPESVPAVEQEMDGVKGVQGQGGRDNNIQTPGK